MSKVCSISGCVNPPLRRGWCLTHYGRWRRHGDPLGGRASPGYVPIYFHGTVLTYEGDECLIWPYARKEKGYGTMRVAGRSRYIHRLVCEHVHGRSPSPSHEAAHSCGKGHLGCVTPKHLSWKTPVENQADKLAHGTLQRGEEAPRAKLTEANVREILALLGSARQRDIAAKFGVRQASISDIKMGRTWAHMQVQG